MHHLSLNTTLTTPPRVSTLTIEDLLGTEQSLVIGARSRSFVAPGACADAGKKRQAAAGNKNFEDVNGGPAGIEKYT